MEKPNPLNTELAEELPVTYINNPFTIALEGIKLLFQNASTVAILLVVLSAAGAAKNLIDQEPETISNSTAKFSSIPPETVAVIVVVAVVVLFSLIVISAIVGGIFSYTTAELSKGHTVSLKQAAKATFDRLWSFVWLQILIAVKVFLWSLLFIVPGIVMAIRYSLANVSFFDSDKNLKGNAAIKDSISLTKGAWRTTLAAQTVFNIITLGLIGPIVSVASQAILYRQFTALQGTDGHKPPAHVLSQIIFAFATIAMIGIGLIIVFSVYGFVNYAAS